VRQEGSGCAQMQHFVARSRNQRALTVDGHLGLLVCQQRGRGSIRTTWLSFTALCHDIMRVLTVDGHLGLQVRQEGFRGVGLHLLHI